MSSKKVVYTISEFLFKHSQKSVLDVMIKMVEKGKSNFPLGLV